MNPSRSGNLNRIYTTRISQFVRAPRPDVYAALIDPIAVAQWRVPDGMTSHIHDFHPMEGGAFRVSLTYEDKDERGKTQSHTDTYHGTFLRLVTNEQVVELIEFETDDPALQGEMTITTTLADQDGGTMVDVLHEGVPDAVPAADNEAGTSMALANLARLLEEAT